MKMNNSVDCQSFFKAYIDEGRDQLWCVRLSLDGQILNIVEYPTIQEPFRVLWQNHLLFQNSTLLKEQLLFVKIYNSAMISFVSDIALYEWLLKSHSCLCDYIIFNQDQKICLSQHVL